MLSLLAAAAMIQQSPAPLHPIPSDRQLAWHRMEQYAFVHFGPNTFTNLEWGEGKEDPNVFNPTQLDCRQWVRAFKDAGLKGVIITAKHHDGFCLWPSKFSRHTVAQSRWRDGKGDVLRELSDACRDAGLKFGVYLSPWDRNHPAYGTPEYNQVFANTLAEVLTSYGPIFEVWFDGANGEGPNGKKQVYDWDLFISTVRKHQPNAVIFSDAGPDVRWVGNEAGHSAPTCWATIDRDRYVPGTPNYKELTEGKRGGTHWVPAECDVSIRPGWFYHAEQDDKVKTPAQLLDLWERSVGQNANFLLNVPPDRRGLIHENDVKALREWKQLVDRIYGKPGTTDARASANVSRGSGFEAFRMLDSNPLTYWAAPDSATTATLEIELPKSVRFNRVELREQISLGQRIAEFQIEARIGAEWRVIGKGTTIGSRRILPVQDTTAQQLRIKILDSLAAPTLSEFAIYLAEV